MFIQNAKNRIKQSTIIPRLLTPFGSELQPDRWIFVIGCNNSGTTLLKSILTKHPLISGFTREGVYLTDCLPFPEQFGWSRMWCRCLENVRIDSEKVYPSFIKRIKKQWSIWLPKNPRNILDDSQANTPRLIFFEKHFQPAYFISIIRNGYAVAGGIRKRSHPGLWGNLIYKDRYPIELCAQQWRETDKMITRNKKRVGRFMQICYEDLVDKPNVVIKDLLDFLSVPPLQKDLNKLSWIIHGKESPIINMNHLSFKRLSEKDLDIIEDVAGDVLTKYSYKRPKLDI